MRTGTRPFTCFAVLLVLSFAGQAFGMHRYVPKPKTRRSAMRRHLRRVLWNPVFRPTHESLLRQNEEINRLDLPRIADDDELEALKLREDLVPIAASENLRFDPRLDPSRRYCRSWTRDFLNDLARAYYARFHDQIQVNSAVRTVIVQRKLRRHNRNAAPEAGETASSHLAGLTVDLQRRGLTREQLRFVQRYLLYMRELGLVEAEEERRHWCFHVMVSERYADWRKTQTIFAIPDALQGESAMAGSE